jgi:ribonuclease Y
VTALSLALLVGGAAASAVVFYLIGRASHPAPAAESDEERRRLLEEAEAEAKAVRRAATVEAQEIAARTEAAAEAELGGRRQEVERKSAEAAARATALERRERELAAEQEALARKDRELHAREAAAEAAARSAAIQATEARARLERIAGLTSADARKALEAELRDEARRAAAVEVKRIEDEAREQAQQRSQTILAAAIQRYASDYVTERTVSVVPLPSDDMKGRIIGREGRNIRALEAATGIDLIIDDTPEAVVISCFNPVRREIARLALTRLIADGRIHPTRIEEIVARATAEIEQQCNDAGEQAAFDLGLGKLHPELTRLLGRLKFRSSSGQSLLQHSLEVGYLAGVIAGELGFPVKTARRAGLLHDIGNAVDQEIEGSHGQVGATIARKCGESPKICHALEAHHGDVPAVDVLDHIVDAANVLSSQRPGARRETLESYVQRLRDLEKIAGSFEGVEKAFAIQMGREVRILVENSRVSDEQARLLSRDIARRVEAELTYPGQIRVAVIRETRATDYAK